MPAPAVYILAILGTVAAGLAFKEFVYEPHIAPRVERWAEDFIANRKARRRQKGGPILVPSTPEDDNDEDNKPLGLTGKGFVRRTKHSDSGSPDDDDDKGSSFELEKLVAKEVDEWRSEVDRSQTALRHRKNVSSATRNALEDSNIAIPYTPISPTHVLFDQDQSGPSTPSTAISFASRTLSPDPFVDHAATLRSPPLTPPLGPQRLPTPDLSSRSTIPNISGPSPPPEVSGSGPTPANLSELDLELLSSSSRSDSPFSVFSAETGPGTGTVADLSNTNPVYQSFSSPRSMTLSEMDLLSASSDEEDVDRLSISMPPSSNASIVADDEDASSNGGSDYSSWASASLHSR